MQHEAEWLSATDPVAMLQWLAVHSHPGDRQLRLFACACCRQVWHLLTDEGSRDAVRVVERYADGLATDTELAAARRSAWATPFPATWASAWAACGAIPFPAARDTAMFASEAASAAATRAAADAAAGAAVRAAVRKIQCELLRDIVGNPFRPVSIAPAWLTWHDGTIPRLAQAIYEEHAFDRLPILADALEEAGCDNQDILDHLRGPGPHARGCHLVDLLLPGAAGRHHGGGVQPPRAAEACCQD